MKHTLNLDKTASPGRPADHAAPAGRAAQRTASKPPNAA